MLSVDIGDTLDSVETAGYDQIKVEIDLNKKNIEEINDSPQRFDVSLKIKIQDEFSGDKEQVEKVRVDLEGLVDRWVKLSQALNYGARHVFKFIKIVVESSIDEDGSGAWVIVKLLPVDEQEIDRCIAIVEKLKGEGDTKEFFNFSFKSSSISKIFEGKTEGEKANLQINGQCDKTGDKSLLLQGLTEVEKLFPSVQSLGSFLFLSTFKSCELKIKAPIADQISELPELKFLFQSSNKMPFPKITSLIKISKLCHEFFSCDVRINAVVGNLKSQISLRITNFEELVSLIVSLPF